MIRVMKDPLILDRMYEKWGHEIAINFCIGMCTLAKDQQCYTDADWWEEAIGYIEKQNKSNEQENTSNLGLRANQQEIS